jgi:hypothetical protein
LTQSLWSYSIVSKTSIIICSVRCHEKDGTFIWTTDQFHVVENHELGHPHGGFSRDHNAWYRSLNMIRHLQRMFNARLIFGHDIDVTNALMSERSFFE